MPLNTLITNTEKVKSVPETVESSKNNETDLDEALSIAGVGIYNFMYGIVLSLFLMASIIEVIGYSYVLPAAKCDLGMTDAQRGLVSSSPYIAIVVTSFPWGYLVDTRGRKRMLVISSLVCGTFTLLAAFMPNLASFIVCKCLANIFLACPSAAPYAFIGEILPQRHRDIALTLTNALQMFGGALVPLLAWAIVPLEFSIDFGVYYFRSWRLLSLVYSIFFIIAGTLMIFGPESPKFLLSQGRHDEALGVLRTIYAKNTGKSADEYPVHCLKMEQAVARPRSFLASLKSQTLPLLQPPYLKWLLLNGFLLFGIFSTLNGLFMWVPDVLNRVLIGGGVNGQTACQVISMRPNHTITDGGVCDDTIDITTFSISSIANVICALITLALSTSVKIIGKRNLLLMLYLVLGSFCVSINFITQDLVFAALLLSLQIIAFGIGPVNAYAVQIFPTHLRGMAVGLALMLGRTGSVVGTNVAGVLINRSCETTFYAFGGLLLFCGILTFLLPSSKRTLNVTADT